MSITVGDYVRTTEEYNSLTNNRCCSVKELGLVFHSLKASRLFKSGLFQR